VAFRPCPIRSNDSRSDAVLPLYRRDPKSIRSIVALALRFTTRTRAPLWPLIRGALTPGWTARNAWSNQNRRVRVSEVRLRAVIATLTPTRPSSGWTV
jgi:hypothetical protein